MPCEDLRTYWTAKKIRILHSQIGITDVIFGINATSIHSSFRSHDDLLDPNDLPMHSGAVRYTHAWQRSTQKAHVSKNMERKTGPDNM